MMMHEHDRLDGLGSGAIFNSINKDVLRTFALQIPPIPEQRKISACLSGLQRAIQIEVDRVRHLQELKAATMAKLFREGLRGEPLKETEIGQIPADWAVKRLGQVCDLQSGGTPDRTKLEYWGGGIPWVKTAEVNYRIIEKTSETISELGLDSSSAKVFPEGTVVMAMYGQGVTRGRVGILGIDAATNQACAALFPHPELNARFLYHWLAHNYHQIREFGHGANQKNLSLTILENLTISVPADLAEQAQIADALDLVNVQIQNAERESEVRKALFESMLQLLMTGQVRLSSELQIGGDK
jgi:type I restriction enzyme S subunit